MNKDQAGGTWEKMMGSAKKVWGELTDDDIKQAEGSLDKLYGIIQKRFGDSKEAVMQKLKDLHL